MQRISVKRFGWPVVIIVLFIIFLVAFFYLDRRHEISVIIQNLGFGGIVLAILLMAGLCMTPFPSEGLLILYLKIYGIYWGLFYAWLGSSLSSLPIFILARLYGQSLLQKIISPERFKMVDNWVERKGTTGLLIARLLPIPAYAVNYITGIIPSVKFWPYIWTAAVSIIPYYIGTALVFVGVAKEMWLWLILGSLMVIGFWSIGYMLRQRKAV